MFVWYPSYARYRLFPHLYFLSVHWVITHFVMTIIELSVDTFCVFSLFVLQLLFVLWAPITRSPDFFVLQLKNYKNSKLGKNSSDRRSKNFLFESTKAVNISKTLPKTNISAKKKFKNIDFCKSYAKSKFVILLDFLRKHIFLATITSYCVGRF